MPLTIALGQMDIVLGDRAANLTTVERLAAEAASRGAELLVLPELWGSGYALEQADSLADSLDSGLFVATADLARRHQLAICGSLLERHAAGVSNTATLFDAMGRRCGLYRKLHLIGLMHEDRFLRPGDAPEALSAPWEQAALAICYDLRFPELFRRYALAGSSLLLIPAEWPDTRIEHWRVLLQARAIENQCIVAACNRVGHDPANRFGGHSLLIDPWGRIVAEGSATDAGLVVGTVDLASVAEVRAFLPVFKDRRPEHYALPPDAAPAT